MIDTFTDQQTPNGDSRLFVVLSEDVHVELLDVRTGKQLGKLGTLQMPHEVVYDNASRIAYVCITYQDGYYNNYEKASHYIQMISADDMAEVDVIDIRPHFAPHGIALNSNRNMLYVTCESNGGEIIVVDIHKKRVVSQVGVNARGPHWMTVLPDEPKAYAANLGYPFVSVVDLERMQLAGTISTPNVTQSIVATPNSSRVFVSSQQTPELYAIDTDADKVEEVISLPEPPGGLAVTPDGSKVLITTFNFTYWEKEPTLTEGYLQVLDANTLQPGARIEVGRFPINVIVSPDGATAFVSNFKDGTVSAVDLETMISTVWPVGDGPHGLAYVP